MNTLLGAANEQERRRKAGEVGETVVFENPMIIGMLGKQRKSKSKQGKEMSKTEYQFSSFVEKFTNWQTLAGLLVILTLIAGTGAIGEDAQQIANIALDPIIEGVGIVWRGGSAVLETLSGDMKVNVDLVEVFKRAAMDGSFDDSGIISYENARPVYDAVVEPILGDSYGVLDNLGK